MFTGLPGECAVCRSKRPKTHTSPKHQDRRCPEDAPSGLMRLLRYAMTPALVRHTVHLFERCPCSMCACAQP